MFSHFDRDGLVDDYVFYYLGRLREIGAEVIFVTACPSVAHRDVERLRPYCSLIVFRVNEGRDFGGFRVGLAAAGDLRGYEEIILANDSVYGPLFDVGESFARARRYDFDLWGITDSWTGVEWQGVNPYHVQSYFLVFARRFIRSRVFRDFWGGHDFSLPRKEVIRLYEIGLSRVAEEAGFRIGAVCDFCEIRDHILAHLPGHPFYEDVKRFQHNPTHYYWRELIRPYRCPFLKIDLVRDNHSNIPGATDWEEVIRSETTYDPALILKHYLRIKQPLPAAA